MPELRPLPLDWEYPDAAISNLRTKLINGRRDIGWLVYYREADRAPQTGRFALLVAQRHFPTFVQSIAEDGARVVVGHTDYAGFWRIGVAAAAEEPGFALAQKGAEYTYPAIAVPLSRAPFFGFIGLLVREGQNKTHIALDRTGGGRPDGEVVFGEERLRGLSEADLACSYEHVKVVR